jgi:hypothetical protein
MTAGRPHKVDPGTLYTFAHEFYWGFRRIAEGTQRLKFDQKEYERLIEEPNGIIEYSPQERVRLRARVEARVEREIRTERLRPIHRQNRVRELEWEDSRGIRQFIAREAATKQIKIPGEPDVIKALLSPDTTAEEIRELCKGALMKRQVEVERGVFKEIDMPAWPIPVGSPLPNYLSQYAEQYVDALHDKRFPRCDVSKRPSNRLKQFWFLSRALAGALYGVTTRTAINLVGSLRPEEMFQESRDAKPRRKRVRRHYKARRAS